MLVCDEDEGECMKEISGERILLCYLNLSVLLREGRERGKSGKKERKGEGMKERQRGGRKEAAV